MKITTRPMLAPLTMIGKNAWEDIVTTSDHKPDHFNRNGLYGYKTLDYMQYWAHNVWLRVPVIARIELFGKIVEHEYGYRAEKAIISRMWLRNRTIDANAPSQVLKMGSLYVPQYFHHIPSYSGAESKVTTKRLHFVAESLSDRYDCEVKLIQRDEEIRDHETRRSGENP